MREAFEKAGRLDCIVFDKVGTLTMSGELVVTDFEFLPEIVHRDQALFQDRTSKSDVRFSGHML
jgi:cation transport ATPase